MRGKHYNKRVSNAMTINVRNDIASHIAETLDNRDEHFRVRFICHEAKKISKVRNNNK